MFNKHCLYFKDYVRQQVSCFHSWDTTFTSDSTLPACTNISELRVYQNISTNLAKLDTQDLVYETGCQVPCTYMKYTLARAMPPTYER